MLRYRPDKDWLTSSQQHNSKLLFEAARKGNLQGMKRILHADEVGIADFHLMGKQSGEIIGTTLIAYLDACTQLGSPALEGTVLLVEHGANMSTVVGHHSSAMEIATRRDLLDVAEYLLVHGIRSNIHKCRSLEMLKLFMLHGADIKNRDQHGRTILFNSLYDFQKQREMRMFALSCGVDIDAVDVFGTTALHKAAVQGDVPTVRDLCQSNASISIQEPNGDTPLHVAVKWYSKYFNCWCGPPPRHIDKVETYNILRGEPMRRHRLAMDFIGAVMADTRPDGLAQGSMLGDLSPDEREIIMQMVGYVPDKSANSRW